MRSEGVIGVWDGPETVSWKPNLCHGGVFQKGEVMHTYTLVLLPGETPIKKRESCAAKMLQPFEGEHWDWWQIGGRYTGMNGEYVPWEDVENYEDSDSEAQGDIQATDESGEPFDGAVFERKIEDIIREAGEETDGETVGGFGLGEPSSLKHPTEWKPAESDYGVLVRDILGRISSGQSSPPSAIITPDGCWHEADPKQRAATMLEQLGVEGATLPDDPDFDQDRLIAEWGKSAVAILRKHEGCLGVTVDTHH